MADQKGELLKPMRDLRGEDIAMVVRSLVESSEKSANKPDEASDPESEAVMSLLGELYGSLKNMHDYESVEGMPGSILSRDGSDPTTEFLAHDSTLAHFLGRGLFPHATALRSKSALAEALTELAAYRWRITQFHRTAELALMDARLHGTCGLQVFRDPSWKIARSVWVAAHNLILDNRSGGDLARTRFRAVRSKLSRSEIRDRWGKEVADHAGLKQEESAPIDLSYPQFMIRELQEADVLDWYWCDQGFKRHIVLVEGWEKPVVDEPHWPYEMPPGKWPILAFPWNPLPNTVWGGSDFRMARPWPELLTVLVHFLADAAAEAAKVVPVYDKALGDQKKIEEVFNLRQPFRACPMNLRELRIAGLSIDDLFKMVQVPSQVGELWKVLDLSREFLGEVTGLREMQQRAENPASDPPRLMRKLHRWQEFLAEVLEAESLIDLTTIPPYGDSLVQLISYTPPLKPGQPPQEHKIVAYLPYQIAEELERNAVPFALEKGLVAEQFPATATKELKARRGTVARTERGDRPVTDSERVKILEHGIGRFISRQSLVESWEGTILRAAQVPVELSFHVEVRSPSRTDDQSLQRAVTTLQGITDIYNRWGLQEATIAWSNTRPGDQPPKMLQNLLAMLREVNRRLGLDDPQTMDLRPEDLSTSLAAGAQMMEQQGRAMAEMQKKLAEAETQDLQLKSQIAHWKSQSEQFKSQTERIRQEFEVVKAMHNYELLLHKVQTEKERAPYLTAQQQARAATGQSRADLSQIQAQKELAKVDIDLATAQAKLASLEVALEKSAAEAVKATAEASQGPPLAPPEQAMLELQQKQLEVARAQMQLDQERLAVIKEEAKTEYEEKKAKQGPPKPAPKKP